MKTSELIDMLTRQSGAAPRWAVEKRLGAALATGATATAAVVVGVLGLNPGLAAMGSALAAKLAYVIGLMLGAWWLVNRSARPGTRFGRPIAVLTTVLIGMAAWALASAAQLGTADRLEFLMGSSWMSCPWRVALLSIPAFAAALWALRGLAPTRPRLAGFAAGLLAGGVGAAGYALHCPELSPLFVVVWYTLGILVPAGLGAVLGPRLLRW